MYNMLMFIIMLMQNIFNPFIVCLLRFVVDYYCLNGYSKMVIITFTPLSQFTFINQLDLKHKTTFAVGARVVLKALFKHYRAIVLYHNLQPS